MRDRLADVIAWSRTHQGRKLIRFTSVSVVSTAVSQGLIVVLFGVTRWMGVIEATLVANCVATIPAYNLNRRWTWGKTGRSHLMKEVVPFWLMSAAGIIGSFFMSLAAKAIVNGGFFAHHRHHGIATLVVMFASLLAFAIFWVLKLIVFNRIFHVPTELEEMDEHLVHEEEHAHDGAPRTRELSPGS